MAECDVTVTVDTATSHLAASLNKPQVAIMADDVKLWQPPGDSLVSSRAVAERVRSHPQTVVEAFGKQYRR